MKSKLGFHIDIQTHLTQIEKMVRAKPKVIKVISSMGTLNILHDQLPDTLFIARDWNVGDDFLRFGGQHDPIGAALRWYNGMKSSIVQAPFAYWESFNEMSDIPSLPAYALFEAERQRIMYHEGFACCIGNFSGGTPEIVDPQDRWPSLYPMLEACNQYHNILGLHEYGGLWLDMWFGPNTHDVVLAGARAPFPETYQEGWLFGRYRKVYKKHIEPNGWRDIRIVLTEFGLDRAATVTTSLINPTGQATGPWTQCKPVWALQGRPDGEQYYVEQLQWADRQMQKDPYLVGATIFTWGTMSEVWKEYDIQGPVADMLVDYIAASKDDPVQFSLQWPTEYAVITQPFGANPQNYAKWGLPGHEGVDMRAPHGSLVRACAGGRVYFSGWGDAYGNHIRIDHENGFKTVYAHLESSLVVKDQVVQPGEVIGLADNTGNSWGSHLHLTLKKEGATSSGETNYPNDIVDPTPYLVFPDGPAGFRLRTTSASGLFVRNSPGVTAEPITIVFSKMEMATPEDPATVRAKLGTDTWLPVLVGEQEGWANALYLEEA